MEDDGIRIGRLDLVDHRIIAAARADDAVGGIDDPVPAGGDICGGQPRAVGEFDIVADHETVGAPAIRRLGDFGADVADELGRGGRVFRIGADQNTVERRHSVYRGEGRLAVTIEARRRVGRDHIGQDATALRRLLGRGDAANKGEGGQQPGGETPQRQSHPTLPFGIFVLGLQPICRARPSTNPGSGNGSG